MLPANDLSLSLKLAIWYSHTWCTRARVQKICLSCINWAKTFSLANYDLEGKFHFQWAQNSFYKTDRRLINCLTLVNCFSIYPRRFNTYLLLHLIDFSWGLQLLTHSVDRNPPLLDIPKIKTFSSRLQFFEFEAIRSNLSVDMIADVLVHVGLF